MSIIFKDNCPCEKCCYCTVGKQHPNPNAYDMYYCEKKQRPIIQHSGNAFHYSGKWIIPCNWRCFIERGDTE